MQAWNCKEGLTQIYLERTNALKVNVAGIGPVANRGNSLTTHKKETTR